jgi:FkbM family methyltransferase
MLAAAVSPFLNSRPIGFIDVGARGGVHPLAAPLGPNVAILGFEPDRDECARLLADSNFSAGYARVSLEPVALAAAPGRAILHETSTPTNTSLLAPNPVFIERYMMSKWQEIGRSTVETTTLDDVLFDKRVNEPDWGEALKIDTQGTEHDILTGARRALLERTLFVCVEVSFCQLYQEQKLFSDVELLLRECGLSFYGFDRVFNRSRKSLDKRRAWTGERMIQADAYFFRDPFDPPAPGRIVDRRGRAILAAFATITGYHDFAIELAESLEDEGAQLRQAALRQAELPTDRTQAELESLSRSVKARPSDANILVGKFVDERRTRNDYYDVS